MTYRFETRSGITLKQTTTQLNYEQGIRYIVDALDYDRGIFMSSGTEYPDRYSRWEMGFVNPPLEVISKGRELCINALNQRGIALIDIFADVLTADPAVQTKSRDTYHLVLQVSHDDRMFPEENRSIQPSAFTPLRLLFRDFEGVKDNLLGFYGAFGYDLIFQFEPIDQIHDRSALTKEMHLFLPDSIYLVDRRKETATRHDYIFSRGDKTTDDLDNTPFKPLSGSKNSATDVTDDMVSFPSAKEFADKVNVARDRMHIGELYELVLHRRFSVAGTFVPSTVWNTMVKLNPSPYEFLCQFGDEQLVGTSPEMFIRVTGDRIESCPISGTVRRGENAMEDAEAIKRLINSEKDEVELTMCTDVDRNDKSRICVPGTVKLLGRRLIEHYAGLFHTVDYVEGQLRPDMTGIDAFLSHMWAVTLTGSPKPMAIRVIENMELEPREWYGGAIGSLMFNGNVSTGITIRTVHMKQNHTHYRVGATLVYDSKGDEEELETQTKATVFFKMLDILRNQADTRSITSPYQQDRSGEGLKLLLIDNEDSFINILADYFRQTGATVTTYRHGLDLIHIREMAPDLVVHSPGPGQPKDFGVPDLVRTLADAGIPQFGVCLGLQGIVEAFGGRLSLLSEPRQGKRWTVSHDNVGIFADLPSPCYVGAYHAFYADPEFLPDSLQVLARNETGIIMAVRHRELPISALQFHPESILSMHESIGHRLIANLMAELRTIRFGI